MNTGFAGKKYRFIAEFEPQGKTVFFGLIAIDKKTKRCSTINSLNWILSELQVDLNDSRFCENGWELSIMEATKLQNIVEKLLTDTDSVKSLESVLDEDRSCGEWANKIR
jgi:hypothetical protein